jgi:hypothetical protein
MLHGDCTLTLLGGWFITHPPVVTPPPVTIYVFCKQTLVVTFRTYESELMLLGHFRKWSLFKLLIFLSKEDAENFLWSVWLPSSSINLPHFCRTPLLVPFLCQISSFPTLIGIRFEVFLPVTVWNVMLCHSTFRTFLQSLSSGQPLSPKKSVYLATAVHGITSQTTMMYCCVSL